MTDYSTFLAIICLLLIGVIVWGVMGYHFRKKNHAPKKGLKAANDRRVEIFKALLFSAEQERAKIGAQLYDDLGPLLSSIKMNLSHERSSDDKVLQELSKTIDDIRDISHRLKPIVLQKYGLKEALEELSSNHKEIIMHIVEWADEASFDETQSLMLFRIVQDYMDYSIDHDKADTLDLSCVSTGRSIVFSISNNGAGVSEGKETALLTIHGRAEVMHSTVRFANLPAGGRQIILTIPMLYYKL